MKLYLLSQTENCNYDTYDSCLVCAKNKRDAKAINPYGEKFMPPTSRYTSWAWTKSGIKCEEIGEANKNQERGVVIASFNAG